MAIRLDEARIRLLKINDTGSIVLPVGADVYSNASLFFGTKTRIGTGTNNTFGIYSTGKIMLRPNNGTIGYTEGLELSPSALIPTKNNTVTLGDTTHKWSNVYATTFTGALSGNASSATKLLVYEARATTTDLNKAANYGGAGAVFHLIASSSTTTGKCPTDANVLQMNWDNNGGYDSQFAISTGSNRAYFRPMVSKGTAWSELVHIVASTKTGSENIPVYVKADGSVAAVSSNSVIVNLASTSGASIYAAAPRPGVTGTLPIANGGTGATSRSGAWTNIVATGGTFTGSITISHAASATMDSTTTNPRIMFSENGSQTVGIVYTDYDSYRSPAGLKVMDMTGSNGTVWFEVTGEIMAGTKVTAPSFVGALSGNAATASALTSITTTDAASSSATWRRIWMSYSNNTTGRPAYDDRFAIQTSTGTLKAPTFSGNLTGNVTGNVSGSSGSCTGNAASATNADKLDGYHSSSFGMNYNVGNANLNAQINSGFYRLGGTITNGFTNAAWGQMLVVHGAGDTIGQIGIPYNESGLYVRQGNPSDVSGTGSWRSWVKILDSSNYSSYALPKSGGTLTGKLQVNAPIFGYNYANSNNAAAFIFDKPGSNYTGIGANGESSTIYFGPCNTDGAWQTSPVQTWKFGGNISLSGTLKWSSALTKVTSPTVVAAFISNDSANGLGYASTSDLSVGHAATTNLVNVILNDTSNWRAAVQWRNTTLEAGTYLSHVARHNTGGNSSYPGSISIVPYATNTSPWSGSVGLFITKDQMNFEGTKFIDSAGKVYGAVWNDYAEYRWVLNHPDTDEPLQPGRCVAENGNDSLSLTHERLQPGAKIISDTYGMCMGETEKAKTPIAVCGRVLAYPFERKVAFHAGDAVCSGPNGTVSKMSREEVMMYPERIVGTVVSKPTYKEWGPNKIPVDGRIWIQVK